LGFAEVAPSHGNSMRVLLRMLAELRRLAGTLTEEPTRARYRTTMRQV
jgi:hypothetical protein